MILCLDVGNTQIHGGVYQNDELLLQFRRTSKTGASSDEFGIFLRSVLRENDFDPNDVSQIAICSVVPEVVHSLNNACLKYFMHTPFFLKAGTKTGLNIRYKNPSEIGADRIANAIAATHMYPDQDLILVDFGTATTIGAVSRKREYLGGVIVAGLRISMEALESRTSKLPAVQIVRPERTLGKTTIEGIQSGLYYGQLGTIREICARVVREEFHGSRPRVIGTGGFASLYAEDELFDEEIPELVLRGLHIALKLNS